MAAVHRLQGEKLDPPDRWPLRVDSGRPVAVRRTAAIGATLLFIMAPAKVGSPPDSAARPGRP
jgi:hypothetical protein